VSKQTKKKFHIESLIFKELNEIDGKEKYRVEISKKFAVLGS
jgi:hypothetical protein